MSDVAAGQELLGRLRGIGIERPRHDPEVELEVRAGLEAAAEAARDLPEGVTVRVTKNRLRQVLLCEAHLVARLGESMPISPELVRGSLLDRLFAQVVVGCDISGDPVADALSAATAARDAALLTAWEALHADEQAEVREVVTQCALALGGRWPAVRVAPRCDLRSRSAWNSAGAGSSCQDASISSLGAQHTIGPARRCST